jgi:hypothetical protein
VHYLKTYGGFTQLDAYRTMFYAYGAVGVLIACCYLLLSPAAEPKPKAAQEGVPSRGCFNVGLHRPESKYIVAQLSVMFAMDGFGGAFVLQTWIAFWFASQWAFASDRIGYLLMVSNIVAGASGLGALVLVVVLEQKC